ncbi:MAG TPA: single-stranded DNA-binding protein [Burkholderiaceae bacterium]|nr:single-stranded DNA-binding protein [Burkholderiaceae bacterium]
MGIYSEVIGNLTQDPVVKTVKVKGEDRQIAEIRVFADYYVKNAEGKLEQDDDRSVGVNVTVWNERLAAALGDHLRKGARVKVEGDMWLDVWHDRDSGEKRYGLRMDADSVTLVLTRIDHIEFRARRQPEAETASA